MKRKEKYPKKGFKDEQEFKRYLLKNKSYVLDLMVDSVTWGEKKFICDEKILMCAINNALGKKTGTVLKIVDWVLDYWDEMDDDLKTEIIRGIIEFECNYHPLIGNDWKREEWYRIVNKGVYGFIDEIM